MAKKPNSVLLRKEGYTDFMDAVNETYGLVEAVKNMLDGYEFSNINEYVATLAQIITYNPPTPISEDYPYTYAVILNRYELSIRIPSGVTYSIITRIVDDSVVYDVTYILYGNPAFTRQKSHYKKLIDADFIDITT